LKYQKLSHLIIYKTVLLNDLIYKCLDNTSFLIKKGGSGGQLTQVIKRRTVQIGIVSFGEGCARPSTPGVYQDVAKYYDWIDTTIKDNSKDVETNPTTVTRDY